MRIIAHSCPDCGTVLAANELEERWVMKCPGVGCEAVLRFEDLAPEARDHSLEHREQYRLK